MINKSPEKSEFAAYYQPYIDLVDMPVIAMLKMQLLTTAVFFEEKLTEEKRLFSYQKGKWTAQQVFGHIIDTERIMSYRALTFARGDKNNLPGFEENDYAASAGFNERSMQSLVEEFKSVRQASITLFESFTPEQLKNSGTANGNKLSVKSLIYIVAGHCRHHENVVKERYL